MSTIPSTKYDPAPEFGLNYRRPRTLVSFITEETVIVSADDLVSVRTSKSMGSPYGTFEIVLKANASNEREPVEMQSNQGIMAAEWFVNLKPMTLVQIAFGSENDLDTLVKDLPQNESYRRVAKRAITMLGYVENVTLGNEMTSVGPQRVVTVTGADLAKLFTLDNSIFYNNSAQNLFNREINSGFDYVGQQGSEAYGYTDAEAKALFTRIAAADEQGQLNFRLQAINGSFMVDPKAALQHIVNAAPNFQVRFANGKNLLNYMQRLSFSYNGLPLLQVIADVDPEIQRMKLFFQHWIHHEGPLWGLFMKFFPRPQVEFFMDTVGLEYHTIVRRPPFHRPALFKKADEVVRGFVQRVYGEFGESDASDTLLPLFPDTDQMTGTPLRVTEVAEEDKRYHVIKAQDVLSINVTKSDQDVVNVYQAVSDPGFGGSAPISQFTHPRLADLPSVKRFGMRLLQFRSPWASMDGMPDPRDPKADPARSNANFYAVAQRETVFAYYYFRDNPAMMSGTAVIRGNATIRIGDRIVFDDLGKQQIAYVEAVSNVFTFGSPYVTQVSFSRMQPLNITDSFDGRLVDYDGSDVMVKKMTGQTPSDVKPAVNQTSTNSTTSRYDLFAPFPSN